MTDKQINASIAEACGVFNQPFPRIPDYCNDLNAMHEAESRFISDASRAMAYATLLLRVGGVALVSEHDELNVDYCWHACRATARQRAEAFLKTIGKWID